MFGVPGCGSLFICLFLCFDVPRWMGGGVFCGKNKLLKKYKIKKKTFNAKKTQKQKEILPHISEPISLCRRSLAPTHTSKMFRPLIVVPLHVTNMANTANMANITGPCCS